MYKRQTLALERTADAWEDQGYLLVLLLLPIALALFRRGWILCLLPLLLALPPQHALALDWDDLWLTRDQQGQRALQAEDYEGAAQQFDDENWAGTAAYRGGDYEAALEHFAGNESADGWYNRGNALARSGKLDEAIEAYRQSLALQPEQTDAQENLALLEQMKQQQEQQHQQGDRGVEEEQLNQHQNPEQEQNPDGQQGQQSPEQQSQQNQDQQSGQQNQDQPPSQQEQQAQASQQEQEGQSQDQDSREQEEEQAGEPQSPAGTPEQQDQQRAGEEKLAEATQADLEEQERDQAMEQWLRRVPDDPSGLLREKFRYESQRRQQQGNGKKDDIYW